MRKIILICVAVVVKILGTLILGLVFSKDIASFTSIVSRTHVVSVRFLLFILSVDILTLAILTHVTKIFFTVSDNIKTYIMFSFISLLIFWLSDVAFIVEIKSGKVVHHLFTLLLFLNKYIVFMLLSNAYILQINKINVFEKTKYFLNYDSFKYKKIISKKLFSYSSILYKDGISMLLYVSLMIYINFLSLFLYSSSVFFFVNILFCWVILFYMLVMAFHQMNVILSIYKNYTNNFPEVVTARESIQRKYAVI